MPIDQIVDLVKQRLDKTGTQYGVETDFQSIVELYRQRVSTINELADSILYCFEDFKQYDEKAAKKVLRPVALEPLQRLQDEFSDLKEWKSPAIHQIIESVIQQLGLNMAKVGQPLRVAVTGGSFSPPIDDTVEIIGKAKTLARIARAISYISAK